METNFRHDFSGKTILIVEDEMSNFALLEALLSTTEAKIIHVTTGIAAIDYAINHPELDMVLMDIKLPDVNGYEVTKRIRVLYPELPIIAQTAFVMSGDKEKALRSGCNAYIPKPIDLNKLLDTMSGFLL
ncbi:MAG: response regulator [Bacteroidetes bacterium HGW-Bacteroidetes-16]|jgi:CheY-like chemotaxis protein|nr:MAG: response regulator [Bacteroidetes bacterium HGW-Bacteroidetes-16]